MGGFQRKPKGTPACWGPTSKKTPPIAMKWLPLWMGNIHKPTSRDRITANNYQAVQYLLYPSIGVRGGHWQKPGPVFVPLAPPSQFHSILGRPEPSSCLAISTQGSVNIHWVVYEYAKQALEEHVLGCGTRFLCKHSNIIAA